MAILKCLRMFVANIRNIHKYIHGCGRNGICSLFTPFTALDTKLYFHVIPAYMFSCLKDYFANSRIRYTNIVERVLAVQYFGSCRKGIKISIFLVSIVCWLESPKEKNEWENQHTNNFKVWWLIELSLLNLTVLYIWIFSTPLPLLSSLFMLMLIEVYNYNKFDNFSFQNCEFPQRIWRIFHWLNLTSNQILYLSLSSNLNQLTRIGYMMFSFDLNQSNFIS